jgi:acylphosphatase
MCDWMRDDMPAALVEDMSITVVAPPFPRFTGFAQQPTV